MPLNMSLWPANTLPVSNNAIAAESQMPINSEVDPMVINNARLGSLLGRFYGTSQEGTHHAEAPGARTPVNTQQQRQVPYPHSGGEAPGVQAS